MLEFVAKRYGKFLTDDIVNLSHDQTAWSDNAEQKSLINYRYAFDLNDGIGYNS